MSYSDNPSIPQMLSPTAYEIGRYGRTPASHFYGLPNISILLTEVRAKGHTIPVTISYNAGGHKPDQHPGWVGLGWSLHAGGSIIRITNGMKDEMSKLEYNALTNLGPNQHPGYLHRISEVQTDTNWNDEVTLAENSLPWMDREPDEYIINADGIHASFYITGEDKIAVVSRDESAIELESYEIADDSGTSYMDMYPGKCYKPMTIRRYKYLKTFIIRDKHGNRYVFGGDDSAIEYSVVQHPNIVSDGFNFRNTGQWKAIATANAWMLTRIERADGEIITFEYEKNGVPIVIRDIHHGELFVAENNTSLVSQYDTYSNYQQGYKSNLNIHFLLPSYLKAIKCMISGDKLNFETENSTELQYPITEEDFNLYIGNFGHSDQVGPFSYSQFQAENYYRRLARIWGVCRDINFEYTDDVNIRLRLNALTFCKNGEEYARYGFSYNGLSLPVYNSRQTDMWGYYNGIDYSDLLGSFGTGMSERRIASEDHMDAEILTCITYPTGGRTEFGYEAHKYSRKAVPFTFSPIECASEGTAGGLRIKSITDYAADGTPQTRTFEYAENGVSSGILCAEGQCRVQGRHTNLNDYYPYAGNFVMYSEMPLLPLSETDGRHVTYSFVRERFPDGGYVDYRFSNFDTSGCQDMAPANEVGRTEGCPLYPKFTSHALKRGLLKERLTYRADGTIILRETYTHVNIDNYPFFKSVSLYRYCDGYICFAAYVQEQCGYPYVSEKTEIRYMDDGTSVTDIYQYDCNSQRLPVRMRHQRNQDNYEERYYYPKDRTGNVYTEMQKAGMHGVIVGKSVLRDNDVIQGMETFYLDHETSTSSGASGKLILPQKTFTTVLKSPASILEYENDVNRFMNTTPDVWIKSYDGYGCPRFIGFRNGTGAEYHWGQRTGQPVMKLQGMDVPFDSKITSHNMRIGYLSPEFSTLFRTTEKMPFEATLYSDYMYGFCVYIRIDDTTYYLTNWSIPEMPDEIWMERCGYTNTLVLDLPAGDHTLVIGVLDWRGNPASQDETGATLRYSYYVEPEYMDLGSFTDLDIDTEEGEGFHCEKGHMGPLTVRHPVVYGKRYILDYMLKSDGLWQYVKTAYAGGDVTIGGESQTVSNVRIYPEDCMPESFGWRPYTGMSARTDARGITESYVFDDAGRLSQTRDNGENVIKAHSYSFGSYSRTTTEVFTSSDSATGIRTVIHYDGLGRQSQDVLVDGAGSGKDLVTLHQYDMMDREVKTWLPSPVPTSGDREAGNRATMDQIMDGGDGLYGASEQIRYSENVFEASPQERLIRKYGPGKAWRDADKAVRTEVLSNGHDQTLPTCHVGYYITWEESSLTLKRNYGNTSPGTYLIEKTEDEDGRTAYVFKNLYGETVMNRQIGLNGAWFDTHFIYDSFGRLEAVLPPKLTAELEASTKSGWSESDISGLAYIYRYDSRGNCIAKLLPGGGWTYYVYDKGNRLVFSQDAVQRENGEWTFYLVDIFGRECVKGTAVIDLDVFADPLGEVNAYVTMPSTPIYTDSLMGYVLTEVSLGSEVSLLKVNYYDSYGFLENAASDPDFAYDVSAETEYGARYAISERGLPTGTLTATLDSSGTVDLLLGVIYRDDRGRPVQTRERTHTFGLRKDFFAYDFVGNITKRKTVLTSYSEAPVEVVRTFTYDHLGRPLADTMKIGDTDARTVSARVYDETGRLIRDDRNTLPSLKEARSYNIRSWLTVINGTHFKERLKYENTTAPQWEGNISMMEWGAESLQKRFQFGYDPLSRLVSATYATASGQGGFTEINVYDKNGNITATTRDGQSIFLTLSGNKVTKIGNSAVGYDAKGRLTSCQYGNPMTTEYNILDLPQRIASGMEMSADYMYDADGRKLLEVVSTSTYMTHRDYVGEFIYLNGSLKTILFDGGYVDMSGATPTFMFFLKDHLGSVRAVISESGTVIRRNDYYPYGDLFEEMAADPEGSTNRLLFTGKELCPETGLHDFGARFLNTRLGRFTTIDPLAEKYPNISPYIYCNCNPVNFVDPDGMRIVTSLRNQSSLEQYSWQFHNDQWQFINTISSEPYKIGTNEYIDNLSHALTSLMRGASGASMIASLSEMPDDVTIGYFNKNTYFPSSDTVGWNYNNSSMIHTENGIERNIPYISLGHELGHAYSDIIGGGYNNGTWYIIEGKSILLDEIISTHLENLFRSENNLPLRQRYSNGGPLIIDKNRGSIYYNNDNQTYFRRVKKSERYIY